MTVPNVLLDDDVLVPSAIPTPTFQGPIKEKYLHARRNIKPNSLERRRAKLREGKLKVVNGKLCGSAAS